MSVSPIPLAIARRRYLVQLFALLGCYLILLWSSLKALHLVSNPSLKVVVAVAPVLPTVFVLLAIARMMSRMDELCQRVHLEAAAWAAGVTAIFALTCAFLENAGVPRVSPFVTFAVINVLYAGFGFILNRRYR